MAESLNAGEILEAVVEDGREELARASLGLAFAKALSDLSGVDVTKLLPVPEISSLQFLDAKKYMDKGFQRILYRFSPDDYKQIGEIWNGLQAETGEPREVQDGPPEGGEVPDLNPVPPLYAPGVNTEDIEEIAKRL